MSTSWNRATGSERLGGAMSYVGGNGNVRHLVLPKEKGDRENSFPAERRRYQIYGAYGCALTQQLLILRRANTLSRVVDFVPVEPELGLDGWRIQGKAGRSLTVADVTYRRSRQNVQGRQVLPLLWDSKRQLVVSNSVGDIIVSLDDGFTRFVRKRSELRPTSRKKRIDELIRFINKSLYQNLCRLAFGAKADSHKRTIHTTLAMFELQLAERSHLLGDKMTIADLALATVLARLQYANGSSQALDLAAYPVVASFKKRMHQCTDFYRTWDRRSVERHFRHSLYSTPPPTAAKEGPFGGPPSWFNRFVWRFGSGQ